VTYNITNFLLFFIEPENSCLSLNHFHNGLFNLGSAMFTQ